MMMFSKHVCKQLSAYCHDELTAKDKRYVSEHLQHCSSCRNEYEQIAMGVRLARHLVPEQAPSSMWSEIERQLNQLENPIDRSPATSLFSTPRLAIAFGLLLLVGISAYLIYLR